MASANKNSPGQFFCPSTNILDYYDMKISEEDTKLSQRCCENSYFEMVVDFIIVFITE